MPPCPRPCAPIGSYGAGEPRADGAPCPPPAAADVLPGPARGRPGAASGPLPLTRRAALGLAGAALLSPALPREAFAMFARMSEAQLVAASDAIVTGTLTGPVRRTPEDRPYALIAVESVLKGDDGATELPLALAPTDRPVSSSDIPHRRGETGLWFLRRLPGEPPLYAADHPQRFVLAEEAGPVLETVRRRLER